MSLEKTIQECLTRETFNAQFCSYWLKGEIGKLFDKIDQIELKLKAATEALEWIDKPDHYEPDNYTQIACFQHRAYNALKAIRGESG